MNTLKRLTIFVVELFVSAAIDTLKKIDKVLYQSAKNEIPIQNTMQAKVLLNEISDFVVFAGIAISNSEKTIITGDCGVCPDTSVDGFPPGIITGSLYLNDEKANCAKSDLKKVSNELAGRTCQDYVLLSGNIGGLTLTPGLYKSNADLYISFRNLTFDALGNENAVFIIQAEFDLDIKSYCKIVLKNKALASNIFWQIRGSATFGTYSVFKGNVIAMQSIEFFKGAKLDGRALTLNGSVFLTSNSIAKH